MDVQQQVQALLERLDDDSATQYFQELAGSHGVEVRLNVDGKGKGVIARKDVAADELVFSEPPLVAGQHATNRQDALVCSHCFSMLGSIEQQIAHRLLARASAGSDAINPDFLRSLWAGASRLPFSGRFPLPSLVHCLGGCTDSQYCSTRCAKASWAAHHALLCSGPAAPAPPRILPLPAADAEEVTRRSSLDRFREAQAHVLPMAGISGMTPNMQQVPRNVHRADALRAFRAHADATNDIFHLAGQLIARTILHAERLLPSGAAAGSPGGPDPRACWEALQRAWRPFAAAWKAPWWQCVSKPEDVPDDRAFRQDLRSLAEESLELLKAAVYDERFPALFSLDVYGSIIGMFELNNLSLYVASPVEDYFLLIHMSREEGGLGEGERNLAQLVTKALLEGLGESYDASCEGSGFYALQSCCNHSCTPNAHAFKRYGQDTDGSAVILAKRDIRAGEEVCMSYIDESQGYTERQAALQDYGFTCTCSKCSTEAATPGKGKATGI